jgi:hypothetical protein
MSRWRKGLVQRGGLAMLLVCLGCTSYGSGTSRSAPQAAPGSPIALQLCVNEWNLMNPTRFSETIAAVTALPRCAVTLPNTYSPSPGMSSCSLGYKPVRARTLHCLALSLGFRCTLNQYRAYECPSHGGEISVASWNARLTTTGALILDRPPQPRPVTKPPGWATRYPHTDGFIIPWIDDTGKLRGGLTLAGSDAGACASHGSGATGVPTVLRCYGRTKVFDPCFARFRNWATVGTFAACPEAPGATRFVRFRITHAVA